MFEPVYYADRNKDVYDADGYDKAKLINHWRNYGLKEDRDSSPVFDLRCNLEKNPDLAKAFDKGQYTLEAAGREQMDFGIAGPGADHAEVALGRPRVCIPHRAG